jgi:drug/metabolite transporter (DMT)-like permease
LIKFNAVYLAERHITSGVVATVFALLLIPSSLLAWAFLGHKPSRRFFWSSLVAVAGIVLLFVHEVNEHPANSGQIAAGIALTLFGMVGASAANVLQARPEVRRFPLFTTHAWSMAFGAVIDAILALIMTGPPVIDTRPLYLAGLAYLALAASVLTFSLYYPVVRIIGPAKAAYSSVVVPIIAMGFSTWLEGYRWTPTTIAGAFLALGGMVGALSRERPVVTSPDAA